MLALSAEAQITKGTKLLGGSIGYNRSTNTSALSSPSLPATPIDYKQVDRNFRLTPRAGAFIADNLAVGVAVNYYNQKATSPYYDYSSSSTPRRYNQVSRNQSFAVNPFVRYYYLPTATFSVFGQLTASYSAGKSKTEIDAPSISRNEAHHHGFGVSISPAMVFFPIDKVGLELGFGSIGYGRSTSTTEANTSQPESKTTSSGFGANFGFDQLSVGAAYYFGR